MMRVGVIGLLMGLSATPVAEKPPSLSYDLSPQKMVFDTETEAEYQADLIGDPLLKVRMARVGGRTVYVLSRPEQKNTASGTKLATSAKH